MRIHPIGEEKASEQDIEQRDGQPQRFCNGQQDQEHQDADRDGNDFVGHGSAPPLGSV